MGAIFTDAAIYTDAIAASMRQQSMFAFTAGYPAFSPHGTYPLALGFQPQQLPHAP
jgi:hypothetical protein